MFTALYDFMANTLGGLFESVYSVFRFFALTPINELVAPDGLPTAVGLVLDKIIEAFGAVFGGNSTLLVVMFGSGLITYVVIALAKWGLDFFG